MKTPIDHASTPNKDNLTAPDTTGLTKQDKTQLRQQYKQIRKQLTADQVASRSRQIAQRLFASPLWQQSRTIMLYLSFQNEVATREIYQQGWQAGKTMLLPICAPSGGLMEMSILTSFAQLVPNRYGIDELPEGLQRLIDPAEIDLALIPGIAFDRSGNRLGFGAGYYDRYLPRLRPDVPRVALAYECQLHSESLPADQYDLPMDHIVTEKQWYEV